MNTTHPGDRDPGADPADEWDREVTPSQTLATALRTAAAAQRSLLTLGGTRVYIAGPMTGRPEFNFPAFREAARELEQMGVSRVYHTASDTPPDPGHAFPWEMYLRKALCLMLDRADAVVVLPGWESSRGARLEVTVALELGMAVASYPDLRPVDEVPPWPAQPAPEVITITPSAGSGLASTFRLDDDWLAHTVRPAGREQR